MNTSLKTTLRLDSEILRQTKKYAVEQDRPLGKVVEESLDLYLKGKKVVTKTSPRNVYRWAETLAKKKGFAHLKEADIVRLIRESR